MIEDIGNITNAGISPSPGLTGGITSNRKSKAQPVSGQQISAAPAGSAAKASASGARYQLPGKSIQAAKPSTQTAGFNYNPSQASFDNTQRSKGILIPPEADANRYEQNAGGSLGQNEELAQNL